MDPSTQNLDEDCGRKDPTSFEFSLEPLGDPGSGYHTKNDPRPGHQYHRYDITQQRKGPMSVRCNMTDVIHGAMSEGGKGYATLLVLDFRFDVLKNARRISRAEITVDFFGEDPSDRYSRPGVAAISYDNHYSLIEQSETKSIQRGAEVNIGVSQIAELSGSFKWEESSERTTKSYTTLIGSTDRETFNFGPCDRARWVLLENKSFKTGVPKAFRAGILLQRDGMEQFGCHVKVKIEADVRSKLEEFFGRCKHEDDPVLFNPMEQVPGRQAQIVEKGSVDAKNLGKVDLGSIGRIEFLRHANGAIHQVNL